MLSLLRRTFFLGLLIAGWGVSVVGAAEGEVAKKVPEALVWDSKEITRVAKPGEQAADFTFAVRNASDRKVEIQELRASCGCTVAEMPSKPWVLEPGARGSFRATADFAGKTGIFIKTIYVTSTAGSQVLTVRVEIPDTEEARRARNQQLALTDRQAVFRGDCTACHVAPLAGKTGGELFQVACGICHMAPHRASMVPDLAVAREPRTEEYWRRWITDGKAGTLMPGFAAAHGGPLDAQQIESLIAYAMRHLPTQPAAQ